MSERFMGEFDPKVTYKKGDVVTLNGEAYRRVRDDGGKVDPFQTMPYRVWQKKSAASGGLVNLLGGPGGGGGTSDAVQYIPQELTESQQMQARKNLGVYGKTQEIADVFPETTITAESTSGGIAMAEVLGTLGLVEEKQYFVMVNGVGYTCTAESMQANGNSIVTIGNSGMTGSGNDTGEPFLFGDYGEAFLAAFADGAGDYTFSIQGTMESLTTIPIEYLPLPSDIEIIANFDDGTFSTSITFDDAWQLSAAELSRRIVLHNSEETKADLQGISPTSVSKSSIRSIGNHIIIEVNGPYAASGTTYTYGEEPMVFCWSKSGVFIMTKVV